ncbi:hypothetical protein HYY73_06565 [Candidatus Woesearchaeota archaeon]|nr:hypothetical protein [Candidatus Woesearchaeota archaeon]
MAVVDSSALIHLGRISKLSLLKEFFGKIMITKEVYDEAKEGRGASEIDEACKTWIEVSKYSTGKRDELSRLEGIEQADASVLLLAQKENAILLCNDYALITAARSKGIICWWITGFLFRCLKKGLLSKREAKQALSDLIESGMRLSNEVYAAMLNDIDSL